MKVSLRWLADYVDLPTSDVSELTRALDYLGHQVEDVQTLAVGWTGVVIGRVEAVEPHPDADQVRVTRVDTGDGELRQVICGAWNFGAGAVVPVAIPGALLPGSFEIGIREIRGVESHGMICSERELGLGTDQEGIMVLSPQAPIGEPFEAILELPDVVFDIEVTTNRPDVMGMLGVARELAAWYGVSCRLPDTTLDPITGDPAVSVSISAPDGCNRFVARQIDGVVIGPSPLWIQERLRKAGQRPISNIVDVTNYVMLEMGHPLHAFDVDRIAGHELDVRWASDDETIVTLDGITRELGPRDLVIADAEGPTSLAAVMGGARSEVVEATTRVLMEAASWDPATVMHTSRRHDLRSEASARFQRGVDPNLAPEANARACRLLAEVAGGTVLAGVIDVVTTRREAVRIRLPIAEVHRILDDTFDAERSAGLLRRLGLEVTVDGDTLTVVVPTYRGDLTRPVDLVEEIARLADFDTFPATVPTGSAGGLSSEQRRLRTLHEALRGLGLVQAVNLPFVSDTELSVFSDGRGVVSVRNPLREDQAQLRQSILPGLLRNVRDNRNRGSHTVAMFETGRVFFAEPWSEDPRVPEQPMRLGVAVAGPFGASTIGSAAHEADADTAFGLVAALSEAMGLETVRKADTPPGLHPTRSARLFVDGEGVGVAGELHPDVADSFEIGTRVAIVEIDLAPILADRTMRQMEPISTFPHVDFDLSFVMPEALESTVLLTATSAVSPLVAVDGTRVVDEYVAEDGTRSEAVRYRLRALDRTLKAGEIAAIRAEMIEAAERLGARLRGT